MEKEKAPQQPEAVREAFGSDSKALRLVMRGTGSALVWKAAGLALGYVLHIVLARWIGATEYGRYSYVLAGMALLATLVGLGLPLLAVRFVPEYRVQQSWRALRGLVQWGGGMLLGLGSVAAVLVILMVQFFKIPALALYYYPLLIGCWLIPLQALLGFVGGLLRGLHRVGWQYAIGPLRHGLLLGAVLVFSAWHLPATSTQVLLATVGIALVVLLGLGSAAIRLLPRDVWQTTATYQPRQWLGISLPLMLVSLFVMLMSQTDVLMVGTFVGPFETGLYRAASRTASLVSLGPIAIGAAADPVLVRFFTQGDQQRLQQLAAKTVRWAMLLAIGISVGLVIFAEPILSLFGKEFVASQGVLLVLVVGHLVYAGVGLAAGLLNLTGHQRQGMIIFGACTVLNLLFNSIGIALFGSLGAAIATLLATVCLSGALWWHARKQVGVDASIFYALWPREQPSDDR